MSGQRAASRVETAESAARRCRYCNRALVAPRPGQVYCKSPARCRQLDYVRRLRLKPHQCACGLPHRPRRKPSRPRKPMIQRSNLVRYFEELVDYLEGPVGVPLEPGRLLLFRAIIRQEKKRKGTHHDKA